MKINQQIFKSVLSICVILVTCFSFGQNDCKCDILSSETKALLLNKRDSTEVFNLTKTLKESKHNVCVYKGLVLETEYYITQKKLNKVLALLQEQEEILEKIICKDKLVYNLYFNKALYYRAKNDFENLSDFAFKALKEAETLKDSEKEIEAIKEIVFLFTRMKENSKRWAYVKRAEKLILHQKKSFQFVINYRWLAFQYENEYTKTERKTLIDSTLLFINKAKKDAFKYKIFDEITFLYRALEACSYHKGELEKALVYIDSAIYYGKKIKEEKNLSGLYLSKAWDHLDLGQLKEAEKWMDTSLYYDKNRYDVAGNMMLHFEASEIYKGAGKLDKALSSFKTYSKMKDSIFNIERIKTVNELETKYETESKDLEIEKKQSQINKLITLFIAVILLIIAILYLLKIKQFRKSKIVNKSLKTALDKQVELEEELTSVRENLAQDFHDDLGNKLARLSFLSKMISNDSSIKSDKVKRKIKQITEDANSLYVGTRDFIFSLKSNSDCLEELVTYLSDFGEEFYSKSNIRFVLKKSIQKDKRLPNYWSRQLVYVFKEAMTNALKYSKANQVILKFDYNNNQLIIECIDDGIGISENEMNSSNGILNMKKRVAKIGGDLIISLKNNSGTTILFIGKTT